MGGALIDAQVAHDLAAERAAGQHALHRLLDHTLGEAAVENELGAALFDAAGEAGVVVIDLLVALATVKTTFSAFTTTTLSPQSTWGV